MPMEIAGLEVERVTSGAPARARPILFLHGMWGGSWMWDHYLSFFAGRGYTGYALNLRGHHGSKPVDDIGRVPFADYLDDARAVAASIGDPIIVGHLMGGLLAQKLAELGDPPAVVALTPAAPRGIFPLCTLELLRVSLVHLHEFLLGRPIHPTPAEADALLFGRIPVAERRTASSGSSPSPGAWRSTSPSPASRWTPRGCSARCWSSRAERTASRPPGWSGRSRRNTGRSSASTTGTPTWCCSSRAGS